MTPPLLPAGVVVAACYLRVSTDRQDASNQRPELERLCAARGWSPRWYEETASGAKARPELERLCDDARRGAVSVVAVWALDRLGRNMGETFARVAALDAAGARVVSVREAWLDTGGPVRSLLLAIFAWVAEQERTRLIERTRAGLDTARRRGVRLGRPPSSLILLHAAAELVAAGVSRREAARRKGVSEAALRRHLARVEKATAPEPSKGPSAR